MRRVQLRGRVLQGRLQVQQRLQRLGEAGLVLQRHRPTQQCCQGLGEAGLVLQRHQAQQHCQPQVQRPPPLSPHLASHQRPARRGVHVGGRQAPAQAAALHLRCIGRGLLRWILCRVKGRRWRLTCRKCRPCDAHGTSMLCVLSTTSMLAPQYPKGARGRQRVLASCRPLLACSPWAGGVTLPHLLRLRASVTRQLHGWDQVRPVQHSLGRCARPSRSLARGLGQGMMPSQLHGWD